MLQNIKTTAKKGFTLIELLIVIGILAILATTAVIILNPAQLLAQARDSQRLNDLRGISGALAFYMSDVGSPSLGTCATGSTAGDGYVNVDPTTVSFTNLAAAAAIVGATRVTDGTGWIPVNLNAISTGSPLPALPVDPTNTAASDFIYRYACNNVLKTYELNAKLESTKYSGATPNQDLDANDGGNNTAFYEIGTEPGLDL